MDYFCNNYNNIKYPIFSEDEFIGLRNAQIGAIHSIASHFTLYNETIGLVIMPTGSGKTAIINMSPYVLRSKKVLVLSSSILVRSQIANEFSTLSTLKKIGVFNNEVESPRVYELVGSINQDSGWNEFTNYDVVITIPQNISQSIKNGFPPPIDLFDLVIVDEAHHSPAETWDLTIKYFKSAKKIFFTATPFRNDNKEVKGKIIYKYSLSKAHQDGIFGNIGYVPVELNGYSNIDISIAKETEKIYNEDNNQYNHKLLVRTEGLKHAKILKEIYENNTNLRLRIVNSSKKYSVIKKTIDDLKNNNIDGIICNNMLGEGFDFPNLKIGAIHKPHKSLAVTLQFIGRFARTNAPDIGEAKFIAPKNDIEVGKEQLYHEESIWQEIIHNLSDEAIDNISYIKEQLDTFEDLEKNETEDDFSMFNLFPYHHLKIFHATEFLLDAQLELLNHEVLYHKISNELNAVILVTKERVKPKWVKNNELDNIVHHLLIIYFNQENGLLFLSTSSKRSNDFYKILAEKYTNDNYDKLSKSEISKVLLDIENPEFFSTGMANRNPQGGESYRILTGSGTEKKIKATDGKLYSAGHLFAKGKENDRNLTIGYSSGAKVWSHQYKQIPKLIDWCKSLSNKILSEREVKTNTGFDNLSVGNVVDKFPFPITYVNWNSRTFKIPINLKVIQGEDIIEEFFFKDGILNINYENSSLDVAEIELITPNGNKIEIRFDFQHHYTVDEEEFIIVTDDGEALADYLNENSLQFVLNDFSNIIDNEWYPMPSSENFVFDLNNYRVINWQEKNIDIQKEYYDNPLIEKPLNNNKDSIHEGLLKIFFDSVDLLIYDHGAYEFADVITFKKLNNKIKMNLYHVKASKESSLGVRVGDTDEVISQCLRCTNWTSTTIALKNKLDKRLRGKENEKIKKGSVDLLNDFFSGAYFFEFQVVLVQPGLSLERLNNLSDEERKVSNALTHLDSSIQQSGNAKFLVLGSQ
ncbi:DEAD/DEAH box helicase [Empedobacter brevis]|uniref:DEAD/DEAH box helicase n=1 Tax=Empedobacter brevis TaxID=247 RepID=UPI00333FCA59